MTARIDVGRIVKLATLLVACAAGVLIYLARTPEIDTASARLASTESMLRSGDVAIAEIPAMRKSRDVLAARYHDRLAQNAETSFLGELGRLAIHEHVTIVRTSAPDSAIPRAATAAGAFVATPLSVELRGSYRHVLTTIARLSAGSAIVRVDAPNVTRVEGDVDATVPVVIYEPNAMAQGALQ